MPIDEPPVVRPSVTVQSQIRIIQIVSYAEIGVSLVILLCQTVAIASSYEFATRSLTGIWTSMFFLGSAGLSLFWTVRCTFNGLLLVLVLQIIAATMAIPLFTACCILLGVYKWSWNEDDDGSAMVGSSIAIAFTNALMSLCSIVEMMLNSYNAYKCWFLAYGGQPKENHNYDHGSISSGESLGGERDVTRGGDEEANNVPQETKSSDPSMPSPPPDFTLASTDILIIKYCGVSSMFLALIIFCSQTAMLAVTNGGGIRNSVGICGVLAACFYMGNGIVTLYSGYKITSQSSIILFVMHLIQLVLSIPVVCMAYVVVAAYGSCLQHKPFPDCSYTKTTGFGAADLSVVFMAGIMALCGMVQGLLSLILILICAQAVCGVRCMISGATVYPML